MKFDIKNFAISFIIGGVIISGVKFVSTNIDNPLFAAMIAGVPIGLISIFFLTSDKTAGYAHNYFYVTLSLLTSIMILYLLVTHTKLSKNLVVIIALMCWMSMIGIRYWYSHK